MVTTYHMEVLFSPSPSSPSQCYHLLINSMYKLCVYRLVTIGVYVTMQLKEQNAPAPWCIARPVVAKDSTYVHMYICI